MIEEFRHVLTKLRHVQDDAHQTAFAMHQYGSQARDDLLRIEGRLARALGDLDYLINLKLPS